MKHLFSSSGHISCMIYVKEDFICLFIDSVMRFLFLTWNVKSIRKLFKIKPANVNTELLINNNEINKLGEMFSFGHFRPQPFFHYPNTQKTPKYFIEKIHFQSLGTKPEGQTSSKVVDCDFLPWNLEGPKKVTSVISLQKLRGNRKKSCGNDSTFYLSGCE